MYKGNIIRFVVATANRLPVRKAQVGSLYPCHKALICNLSIQTCTIDTKVSGWVGY